jgi:hypothetical protein
MRPRRLVRENEPNIVCKDETESPSRPKTVRAGDRSVVTTASQQEDT